jgi:hypothetical protein
MTDIDKTILRSQLQAANGMLASAKGMANAPIMTPSGPAMSPAPGLICGVLEQLTKILDQMIDKI